MPSPTARPRPWFKEAVYYHLDLATFFDHDGDGHGDLCGLIDQLDYLSWLGVGALWLSPFYPSPGRDHGYDITDHVGIDPRVGTPGDFLTLIREADRRGIRIVADLVINHTSDQHPWFQSARHGPDSPHYPFYVWTDDPANEPEQEIVFPGYQQSAWQFEPSVGAHYLHHFYHFQPDLNTDASGVRAEIRNIVDYWSRLGVAGFRIDAAPFLAGDAGDDHGPHQLLRQIHAWANERGPEERPLLAEADLEPEALGDYFGEGDQVHLLFNFYANQFLFLALADQRATPLAEALARLPEPPPGRGWLNFLRHHDELSLARLSDAQRERVYAAFGPEPRMQIFGRGLRRRLAPMLGGDRRTLELVFSLLFSLPGAPLIYYGDEIGMGENLSLPERTPVRTPMQWSGQEPNGGFSTASPRELVRPMVTDPAYAYPRVNVDDAQRDPASLLHWVRTLIRLRKTCPEIAHGRFGLLAADADAALAHRVELEGRELIALHNLSPEPQEVRLDRPARDLTLMLGEPYTKVIATDPLTVRLTGHGYGWLRTKRAAP